MKIFITVLFVASAVSAVKPRFNSKFQRQVAAPHPVYGPPPANQPPQEYGPPAPQTTTQSPEATTTEMPTTTEPESETVNTTTSTNGRLTNKGSRRGVYYIYHPSGQLQKVIYSTKKDAKNQAYTTQVKYEDVKPITAPIYTYDPKTLALSRLQA